MYHSRIYYYNKPRMVNRRPQLPTHTAATRQSNVVQDNPQKFQIEEEECHICYEKIPLGKGVTCLNGHSCCQRHHLERIRSIYQEGRCAFNVPNKTAQDCFICRCAIGDHSFSQSFLNLLTVIQAIEIPKMYGRNIHPLDVMNKIAADKII